MRNTPSSFEFQHTGAREIGTNAAGSTSIHQRQKKVGFAVSALLSTIGLSAGCAQNDPAPAQSPAAYQTCQHDHFVQKESRSEEHTSELQSRENLVCRPLLEKKKKTTSHTSQREARHARPIVTTCA